MEMHSLYCFRPPCSHDVDSPEKTTVTPTFPTMGTIGGAVVKVEMDFCSPRCAEFFFELYNTSQQVIDVVSELVKNAIKKMPTPRQLSEEEMAVLNAEIPDL